MAAIRVNITIDERLRERARLRAKATDDTFSGLISAALRMYIQPRDLDEEQARG